MRGWWTKRAGGAAPGQYGGPIGEFGGLAAGRALTPVTSSRLRIWDRLPDGQSAAPRDRSVRPLMHDTLAVPGYRHFPRARADFFLPGARDSGTLRRMHARTVGPALHGRGSLQSQPLKMAFSSAGEGRPVVAAATVARPFPVRSACPSPHDAAAGRFHGKPLARTGVEHSGNGSGSSDVGRMQGTLRAVRTPRYRARSGCERPVPESTGTAYSASAAALCILGSARAE